MFYTKPTPKQNNNPAAIVESGRTVCSHAQACAQPGHWELHMKVALLKVEDLQISHTLVDESYAFPKDSLSYLPMAIQPWRAARQPFKGEVGRWICFPHSRQSHPLVSWCSSLPLNSSGNWPRAFNRQIITCRQYGPFLSGIMVSPLVDLQPNDSFHSWSSDYSWPGSEFNPSY